MDICKVLKEYMVQTSLSISQVSKLIGINKSTLSRILNGQSKHIQEDTKLKISQLLGTDLNDVMKQSFQGSKPILGSVKAGYSLFCEENYDGYIDVSKDDQQKGDYFLRVIGDSMNGSRIHDGDLLFVEQCNDVPSGTIGIVVIANEEVTVKKIVKKEGMMILEASNPLYENRYYTKEEVESLPVRVIGKVVYAKSIF